ncbi:MAG: 8-oxoguanine DNA glycosylase [Christensenellaceae bacterium]|jgi:N-glycosylase/DNA lyase|nr:8-oxoguanine DNA glycosylase [Christensenellaceae bacterium]
MIYETNDSGIVVHDLTDFNPKHVLECGQVFRYTKISKGYRVFSQNFTCILIIDANRVIINTSNTDYFIKYFDLDRDYSEIKRRLSGFHILKEAIEFGSGIRILNQDPVETIFSFILSANNNIKRIQNSIEKFCRLKSDMVDDFYPFPSLDVLGKLQYDDLKFIGAGYRAVNMIKTMKLLSDGFDLNLSSMSTHDAKCHLMKLYGVGSKVADCILLFAYKRTDVFPTDVWIAKAYNEIYDSTEKSKNKIAKNLVSNFGELAGYAQQYLFYYFREKK